MLSTSAVPIAMQNELSHGGTMPPPYVYVEVESSCRDCSQMVKESQILLCDGPGCNGEICFDCAGIKRVPTGNFYCYLCDPPEPVAALPSPKQDRGDEALSDPENILEDDMDDDDCDA